MEIQFKSKREAVRGRFYIEASFGTILLVLMIIGWGRMNHVVALIAAFTLGAIYVHGFQSWRAWNNEEKKGR